MFLALIGTLVLGYAGYGLLAGRITLRDTPIYREQQPTYYWFAVGTLALIGGATVVRYIAQLTN